MSEKTEDIIRKKLKDFSRPAPEGLWERIEASASLQRRKKALRLWTAASLAAAAAVIFAIFMLHTPEKMKTPAGNTGLTISSSAGQPSEPAQEMPAGGNMRPAETAKPARPDGIHLAAADAAPVTASIRPASLQPEDAAGTTATHAVTDTGDMDTPGSRAPEKDTASHADRLSPAYGAEREKDRPQASREKHDGWSISVAVDGKMNSYDNLQSGFIMSSPLHIRHFAAGSISKMSYISDSPKSKTRHHLPITLSVTVTKSLNKRFSVETGLQYTLLASDMTSGGKSYYTARQRLQYLGIPLKVNYTFFEKHGFSSYVSAGGALDKCIKAKTRYEYVNSGDEGNNYTETNIVKNLQYSVSASAGIKYNFAKRTGLYFEPGITYYFDDGTRYETIRKKRPLNFSLKLGLSFDF